MPLRLQVISAHRESMGGSYLQEFAACGGTIGRSLQCDWPLPDAKRFISSQHAMIDYQGGAYYLVDLSRNGVFVNNSKKPVGKGNPQRLFDGDIIRLGEFEISVAIIEDPNEAEEDGMRNSIVRAQMVSEDESVELAMLPADQIRDENVLERALHTSNTSGQISALREKSSVENKALQPASEKTLNDAAAAFLQAAGLKANDFAGMDPVTLLQNAGRLLAEFTECTHALLMSKDAALAEFNIRAPNARKPTNPLRSAVGMANALRLLLGKKNSINSAGVEAVDAAFHELDQHQHAVINAMQSALSDYLENFEPRSLEQHFAQQTQRSVSNQKAFRDQYAEVFAGLSQPNKYRRPQRFDEKFSRAYEVETGE